MAFPFEYPADVATLLAQICCHKKRLPQGAPTSPIISNYICRRMDRDLARLARSERCYYTRYADDLSFSTDRSTFPASLGYQEGSVSIAGHELEEIIKQNGFKINEDKTHLMRRTQRQRVTGLVVNEKANVHRDYFRSLRNLLYIWTAYGEPDAVRAFARAAPHLNWPPGKPVPSFRRVVQGRVQHVGSIKGWESPVYRALAESLSKVDDTYKPHPPPPVPAKAVRLFTEGKTDGIHLTAALRHFHDRGEFTDLELGWQPLPFGKSGDAALLDHCRDLADSPQERVCVCLFDRDNPQRVREAVGRGGRGWKNWGNGVAAVAIVPVGDDQAICIELLYRREELTRQNDEGRRVFLGSEFDRRTGHHVETDGKYTVPRQAETLIREEVHEIGSRQNVALTKTNFAQAVADQTPPFEDVSFEGFRPTLELIRKAVRSVSPREGADE